MPSNSAPMIGFGVRNSATLLAALPPLSLYIHIPWCIKKCPYCDFNSHESKIAIDEKRYINALIADLDATLPKVWGRRLHSIFFGGGTPSLFSAAAIDAILTAVRARLMLDHDAEITLEANPGTFEMDKFKGYRDAGVNRLSIGIQSFNAKHLSALGRVHNDDEAKRAITIAQRYFDNINLDIMFALPTQTLDECVADVDTALSFGTNHVSIYHLTLEPNTLFHRFPPPLPDDDVAADMQDMIHEKLSSADYVNYETSAYARLGSESKHNLNYWRFGDYIGIGAGAHGKISTPDKITRETRYKQPTMFMDAALSLETGNTAIQETKVIAAAELPFEFMLNALRLTAGFQTSLFTERTGLTINAIARECDEAEAKGFITRDHLHIRPTEKGRLFLNDLLAIFLRTA